MNEKFLKGMFNSSKLPNINFDLSEISLQAQKLAGKLSISGVQPKLSLKMDKKNNELIVVNEGGEYILKPQTSTFENIPENEQCCMDIAQEMGIDIPLHCLLPLADKSLAYLVKRFDREKGEKIHQEEFTQILEQNDKYRGSVEQIGRSLREKSSAPGYDIQLLFERVVFNFIIGNGDAHLRNYSISYKGDNIRLAPAYDIVCSKLVISTEEDSAITINGKKNNLRLGDFNQLGEYLNVPEKIRYERFGNKFDMIKKHIESSCLDRQKKERFIAIVKERLSRLELQE